MGKFKGDTNPTNIKFFILKEKFEYSPFRGNVSSFYEVAFSLFLAPAGGSNPAGLSPNLS